MARQSQQTSQRANPYLSPNQQDLLLAALNSQAQTKQTTASQVKRSDSDPATMNAVNGNTLFMSPNNGDLDNFEYTPELDYLDVNDNFDFENADLGGDMIGALPGSGAGNEVENGDGHEKRKSPDDNNDEEGGDAKRQETKEGEKGAKKPGRKPLTNEPTTVSVHPEVFVNIVIICTNVRLEAQSSKSCCPARLPRAQRGASQRPRNKGHRAHQSSRSR